MDPELKTILAAFSFALGACVASFLNVVAWRLPRGESIVSPPSHCPKCNMPIRWWQNIPIISWLALRGKCANCREPISPRYIIVEAIGGALFLAAFLHIFGGDSWASSFGRVQSLSAFSVVSLFVWWAWMSLMLVGSVIDFDHKLLPDFVTEGGMVLGVAQATVFCLSLKNFHPEFTNPMMYLPLIVSLSGLVLGFGLLWLVRFLGSKAFKREAMGMGDVFLMGAVGALFGPVAVVFTLVVSSLVGSVAGLSLIALNRLRRGRFVEIPFGPYICAACLIWMLAGEEILKWYIILVFG